MLHYFHQIDKILKIVDQFIRDYMAIVVETDDAAKVNGMMAVDGNETGFSR